MSSISPRPTCVVIDCNTWTSQYWLGSPVGQAFIAAVRQDSRLWLAIPEVLETELNKHRSRTASEYLSKLTKAARDIDTVMGKSSIGIITLDEAEIEVGIHGRITPILDKIKYSKMTLGEVRRALEMVNAGVPPNGPKGQQMKDSLLWEACVSLAVENDVYFVSADSDFYSGKDPQSPLAPNLAESAAVLEGRLRVFRSLNKALHEIAPGFSADSIAEFQGVDIDGPAARLAEEALSRSSVAATIEGVRNLRGVYKDYLKTESPSSFAVSFTVFYDFRQHSDDANVQDEVAISGECMLDMQNGTVDSLALKTVNWKRRYPNGKHTWIKEDLAGME
ncbi:PIN domain-containing protein [Micromonospora aurantiaca (nom. illeg.)]|uniref:PIN domain-containing protein n=1 Tax=Micromonospora aurantiaca (nom. illeg.) TaxID=47850 RepID=UPI003EBCB179